MRLFGGIVDWKANEQATVTASTEAELLSLSQAAKEGIFPSRLLTELSVKFEEPVVQTIWCVNTQTIWCVNTQTIWCDNTQTIRLVNDEIAKLQTKLRHVDIHNHWLRQEVQEGRIKVSYMPADLQIADGLTKSLTAEKHHRFLQQLNMVDISNLIKERRDRELSLEDQKFEQLINAWEECEENPITS